VDFQTVQRAGIAGTRFNVTVRGEHHEHRHLADILDLIAKADLPGRAGDRASEIFTRLAHAEAKVHGIDVEQVHFHEVGAVDSIVDVVGAVLAMEQLNVDRVLCSPIPVGSGTVTCEHGKLPTPAPATAQMLVGAPTYQIEFDAELTTPTAAAVLTTLSEDFIPIPEMEVTSVGYGAGRRETGPLPNVLRVFLGQQVDEGQVDSVVELSANIDDCTGEIIGATIEKLLAAGCLDAWAAPIVMKKSRPAWTLAALCTAADVQTAEQIIFTETTSLGIRRRRCTRSKLTRRQETIETPYGPIRMKIGVIGSRQVTACPEFSECLAAANAHHVPVKEVVAAAIEIYRRKTT
jgi:uncharacterized protein (TIGR00299 family) protein